MEVPLADIYFTDFIQTDCFISSVIVCCQRRKHTVQSRCTHDTVILAKRVTDRDHFTEITVLWNAKFIKHLRAFERICVIPSENPQIFSNISCHVLNTKFEWKFTCRSLPPFGSVVGILSYPKNLAASSATSAMQWISWRKVGATISFVSGSRVSSTFARYASISSFVRSVPRSALMRSAQNGTLEGSLLHCRYQPSSYNFTCSQFFHQLAWHGQLLLCIIRIKPFFKFTGCILYEVRFSWKIYECFRSVEACRFKSTVFIALSVIMEFSPPMIRRCRLLSLRHRSSEPDHPFHVPGHPMLQIFLRLLRALRTISLPSIVSRSICVHWLIRILP